MSQQKKLNGSHRIFNIKATISFTLLVVLFLLLAPPVLALQTGIDYGTITGLSTQDIRISIMKIVRVVLGLVGIIAIIIILYAGYTWMTSGGNSEKIDQAKKILTNAVIGLAIILLAFSIVSFIIRMLGGITPSVPFGPTPPGACENCGHLGSGIIQSVYPEPNQRNVFRNTLIMVTFKVDMKADSIIAGCAALPCSGNLAVNSGQPNVKIYQMGQGEDSRLNPDQVVASTNDGLTFVFDPIDYLDGSANNIWYSVKLMGGNNGIQKSGTQPNPAFPGANGYFLWRFGVGDLLDLDPVEVKNVIPEPDNLADDYSMSKAVAAAGSIELNTNPTFAIEASYNKTANPTAGTLEATVSGDYNGTYEGNVTVVLTTDTAAAKANIEWGSSTHPNSKTNVDINANTIDLGSGLRLTLASDHAGDGAVNAWTITNLVPKQSADTLSVGDQTYVFVDGAPTKPNEITRADKSTTANNIKAVLDKTTLVSASVDTYTVTLTVRTAGAKGNTIRIQASGSWANLCNKDTSVCNSNQVNFSGGKDADLTALIHGAADKARNIVFLIEFNEAINPLQVNASTIVINYYDGTTWVPAAGKYLVSNQYKTVEVLSNIECKDASNNPLVNSCGDKIYCWPVNPGYCETTTATACDSDANCPEGEKCVFEPTQYQIKIQAGSLKPCANNDACGDNNFSFCRPVGGGSTVCQGDNFQSLADPPVAISVFYPEAADPADGITDAAKNSFNGNRDGYSFNSKIYGKADGPESQSTKPAYELNKVCSNNHSQHCVIDKDCGTSNQCINLPSDQGDDLIWSFYLNKSLDLSPPQLIQTGPNGLSPTVSLTSPIEASFNEIMFSSSLRPDNHYQDGYCECDVSQNDANGNNPGCLAGQTCENSRCKNQTGEQIYCTENKDCKNNAVCFNRKYVTLIDPTVLGIGYWVTAEYLDISPKDSYPDQTKVVVRHSQFAEMTDYGTEIGSGVKDLYQNCYLPSMGPAKVCQNPANLEEYGDLCSDTTPCSGGQAGWNCVFVNHCSLTITTHCDDDLGCPLEERCVSTCDPATGKGCCGVSGTQPYCCEGVATSDPCQHCANDATRPCGSNDDCKSGGKCVF